MGNKNSTHPKGVQNTKQMSDDLYREVNNLPNLSNDPKWEFLLDNDGRQLIYMVGNQPDNVQDPYIVSSDTPGYIEFSVYGDDSVPMKERYKIDKNCLTHYCKDNKCTCVQRITDYKKINPDNLDITSATSPMSVINIWNLSDTSDQSPTSGKTNFNHHPKNYVNRTINDSTTSEGIPGFQTMDPRKFLNMNVNLSETSQGITPSNSELYNSKIPPSNSDLYDYNIPPSNSELNNSKMERPPNPIVVAVNRISNSLGFVGGAQRAKDDPSPETSESYSATSELSISESTSSPVIPQKGKYNGSGNINDEKNKKVKKDNKKTENSDEDDTDDEDLDLEELDDPNSGGGVYLNSDIDTSDLYKMQRAIYSSSDNHYNEYNDDDDDDDFATTTEKMRRIIDKLDHNFRQSRHSNNSNRTRNNDVFDTSDQQILSMSPETNKIIKKANRKNSKYSNV